jgi:hypothetical protein
MPYDYKVSSEKVKVKFYSNELIYLPIKVLCFLILFTISAAAIIDTDYKMVNREFNKDIYHSGDNYYSFQSGVYTRMDKDEADRNINSCGSSKKSNEKYIKSIDRFNERHKIFNMEQINILKKTKYECNGNLFSLFAIKTKEDKFNDAGCDSYPLSVSRIHTCNGKTCQAMIYTTVKKVLSPNVKVCIRALNPKKDNNTVAEINIQNSIEGLLLSNTYSTGDPNVLSSQTCNCLRDCNQNDLAVPPGINFYKQQIVPKKGCAFSGTTNLCTLVGLSPDNKATVSRIDGSYISVEFGIKVNDETTTETWDGKGIKHFRYGSDTEITIDGHIDKTHMDGFIAIKNNEEVYKLTSGECNDIGQTDYKRLGWNQVTQSGLFVGNSFVHRIINNFNLCDDQGNAGMINIDTESSDTFLKEKNKIENRTGKKWNTKSQNSLVYNGQTRTSNNYYTQNNNHPSYPSLCWVVINTIPANITTIVNQNTWDCIPVFVKNLGIYMPLSGGSQIPSTLSFLSSVGVSSCIGAYFFTQNLDSFGNIVSWNMIPNLAYTASICAPGTNVINFVMYTALGNYHYSINQTILGFSSPSQTKVFRTLNNDVITITFRTNTEIQVDQSVGCPVLNGKIEKNNKCFNLPIVNGCGDKALVFVHGDVEGSLESFQKEIRAPRKKENSWVSLFDDDIIQICPRRFPQPYNVRITIAGRQKSIHVDLRVDEELDDDNIIEDDETECGLLCKFVNWFKWILGISYFESFYSASYEFNNVYNVSFFVFCCLILIVPVSLAIWGLVIYVCGYLLGQLFRLLGFIKLGDIILITRFRTSELLVFPLKYLVIYVLRFFKDVFCTIKDWIKDIFHSVSMGISEVKNVSEITYNSKNINRRDIINNDEVINI